MKRADFLLRAIYAGALMLGFLTAAAIGQEPELKLDEGVAAHSGIDAIYKSFSRAYRTMDAGLVASLYTEDAAYLSPGSEIRIGRDKILNSFARSFEYSRSQNRTIEITFQIVQRKVENELGYDVGIYRVYYSSEGKIVHQAMGKYVVVTIKGNDGIWRFQVDGYSDLKPPADSPS